MDTTLQPKTVASWSVTVQQELHKHMGYAMCSSYSSNKQQIFRSLRFYFKHIVTSSWAPDLWITIIPLFDTL